MSNQIKAWQTTGLCNADVDAELDKSDDEPSLGAPEPNPIDSQEHWERGGSDDREGDPAESGTGDYDGLLEQDGTQDWQQGGLA
jgi:hypothetical protein